MLLRPEQTAVEIVLPPALSGTFRSVMVSTTPMAPISRWRRVIRIAAFSILVLVAVMAISVQVQQHILRWRAERLLSDIRALQLGKSTWADAQKIMYRWGVWGFYEGSCTEKRCTYQIAFRDSSRAFPVVSEPNGNLHSEPQQRNAWILKAYQILGGRSAMVAARVEVINGFIWGKDYELSLNIPGESSSNEEGYILGTDAETVWKTKDLDAFIKTNHPEYMIEKAPICSGCELVFARFTPFADPQIIASLFDFNLGCLTHLILCRHPDEIAPNMWKRAEEDKRDSKVVENAVSSNPCTMSREFLGRDQENVVIAEVVESKVEHRLKDFWSASTFLLVQRLKRADFWDVGDVRQANTSAYDISTWETGRPGLFKPGSKVILVFESPGQFTAKGWIDLDFCNILPATEDNLAAVMRGVRQDIFPLRAVGAQ
jgi:hypothetical protein